jgi:hypothetical protein
VARIEECEQEERIARWKERLDGKLEDVVAWAKRALEEQTHSPAEEVNPQQQRRVQKLANDWHKVWNPEHELPDAARLDGYCDWIPEGGFQAPAVEFDPQLMWASARGMHGKGAGTDGWDGTSMCHLPRSAFVPMAALWKAVWEGAPLPHMWHNVRMALIPKPDGSARPLGLMQIMCRATRWLEGQGRTCAARRDPRRHRVRA